MSTKMISMLLASFSFFSLFLWTFRVRLMLSSPNARLIVARVSVAHFPRFAQNVMHIQRRFVGSIAKSHQARYTAPNKGHKENQYVHPAA
jgi:hypothetical protein